VSDTPRAMVNVMEKKSEKKVENIFGKIFRNFEK